VWSVPLSAARSDGLPQPHRLDIEGLRAVAVIAVLLFHLGFPQASGGFVGVDVFFVISGFLIGGIVVREADAATFRFGQYLVRRVRRIVPVMLVVLATVSLAAIYLLLPNELADYASSLGYSTVFAGNIHLWLHRGAYAESDQEILLHMWTLGVEGQFYLVLPLIALALMKLGRRALWCGLAVLGAGSAVAALLLPPTAAFYLLPPRLWEFLLGMMLAITPLPFLHSRWLREGLAIAGFSLIVFAATAFDAATPFPGWRAAIPCFGAVAIIAAGTYGTTMTGRVLILAPVRFLGKISYSLYLWHWPVIVLLLLGLPAGTLTPELQLVATLASFALAILSWRFVEEPFRRGGPQTRAVVAASAAGAVGLLALAGTLALTAGLPDRFSQRGREIAAGLDYPLDDVFRSGTCFIHHRSQSFDPESCLFGSAQRREVLLLGDSHAANLWPGLEHEFPGSAISQVTAAGCRPALAYKPGRYPFCAELMRWAVDDYISGRSPHLVVLAARWEEGDLPALRALLVAMADRRQPVLVVGPPAEWAQFVPRLLALSHERGRGVELAEALRFTSGEVLDRQMAAISAQAGATYVSLLEIQCGRGCRYFGASGDPLLVDDSHFTLEASKLYAREFDHPALVRASR
jgi:peptidoglycan/LPS O-acetylase OafA/YrhL